MNVLPIRSRVALLALWLAPACLITAVLFAEDAAERVPLTYPETRTVDHVDEYFGEKVADPYRWLEDLESDDVAAWVEAQNEVTFGYLNSIPGREPLTERLTELWNYERYSAPFTQGGRTFYYRNDGLQAQSVLYVMESMTSAAGPRVLIDPNTWTEDGTKALSGISVSRDGKRIAYAMSTAGSDWKEWRVRDIDTGKDLEDHIQWTKFTRASWAHDGSGFYYAGYEKPDDATAMTQSNTLQRLYFHKLGTPQSEDELIYERPDQPEWGIGGSVTDDGRFLVVSIWTGSSDNNAVFVRDLSEPDSEIRPLLDDFDAKYYWVDSIDNEIIFYTTLDAPRGRVIAVDVRNPTREKWVEIIPQVDDVLDGISLVNDTYIAEYMHDAHTRVEMFKLDGSPLGELELPGLGSAGGFNGERTDTVTYYTFSGFTTPTTIYRLDMKTRKSSVFRKLDVKFDPSLFESKQVFYESKDGTKVPMFITHKKGVELDGTNPTLLYGYGGFNSGMSPWFSIYTTLWCELGGVYAVACLRGGGEYGEDWHQAGMRENKQNVFDDFIAAGEWLIANKYTSSAKLAIKGGSNGGLLVGACLNQRPDLFGAALPAVGVMDMLRYHTFTIGWAWVPEYGSSAEEEMFPVLRAYSPYHNVKPGTAYPPTMITTSDHDDRVVPCHSYKYAAAMQAAQAGDAPIILRVETKGGHGAGLPTAKRIAALVDELLFLSDSLGIEIAE